MGMGIGWDGDGAGNGDGIVLGVGTAMPTEMAWGWHEDGDRVVTGTTWGW